MIDIVSLIVALTLGSAGGTYNLECSTNLPANADGAAFVAETNAEGLPAPRVVLRPRVCRTFLRTVQHRPVFVPEPEPWPGGPTRWSREIDLNFFLEGVGVALHEARHVWQYRTGWTNDRSPDFRGYDWNAELDAECFSARHIDDLLVGLGYGRRVANRASRHYLSLIRLGPPPYGGRCPTEFGKEVRTWTKSWRSFPRSLVARTTVTFSTS